jgi:hypothetical protein
LNFELLFNIFTRLTLVATALFVHVMSLPQVTLNLVAQVT